MKFPPADLTPPEPRSAQPDDGKWQPLGDATRGDRAAGEPRLLYYTRIHPHAVSKFKTVTVVAIDLQRASLGIVAGVDEPESKTVTKEERSGLVPASEQERLLAVFNGSWQARHGHYGMMKDGAEYLPPREDACTLGIARDGSVQLASWPKLSAAAPRLQAWRQAPSCILEEGKLHPELERNDDRRWGGKDPKRQTRRRSAIALGGDGKVLFYGFGDETTVKELALGLRSAGATSAAQLDINYYWVRFLLFGQVGADPLRVTSTLIPKMEHRKRGYVHLAEPRDFFYVLRKPSDAAHDGSDAARPAVNP